MEHLLSCKYPEIKIFSIQIEKLGIKDKAPGIAIVDGNKKRFFTAAHWFFKGNKGRYRVYKKEKVIGNVTKIKYLGNDIAQLEIGKEKPPLLEGIASTFSTQKFRTQIEIEVVEPFKLKVLEKGTITCYFKYQTKRGSFEKRYGYGCDGQRFKEGDSGKGVISEKNEIFIITGVSELSKPIKFSDGTAIKKIVFINPIPALK